MPPSGVLFDFDGVIVDSLRSHLAAWSDAFQACFGEPLDPALYREMVGRATVQIGGTLARLAGFPEKSTELVAVKSDLLKTKYQDIPLLPGAREAFQELERLKIPYGIASNAPRAFVAQVVAYHRLKVPVALGREDAARPKPAPDLYLTCAKALGLGIDAQRATLVFEDSVHGLRAGVAAGMVAIGVTTQESAATLQSAGAHSTVAHLGEALERKFFVKLPLAPSR